MGRRDRRSDVGAQPGEVDDLHARHIGMDPGVTTDYDQPTQVLELIGDLGEMVYEVGVGDDGLGTAEVQCMQQRWTTKLGVQQGRDSAQGAQRQPGDREGGAVGHQHRHELAALHTEIGQAVGEPGRASTGLAEGQVTRREAQERRLSALSVARRSSNPSIVGTAYRGSLCAVPITAGLTRLPVMNGNFEYDTVLSELAEGGVRTITLNRPERLNAMNRQLIDDVASAFDDAHADRGDPGHHLHRCGTCLLRR